MSDVFGWCTECGQFVGRACCWGPGLRCARCEQAHPAGEPDPDAGGFAALAAARAAVRHLDGTAVEFSRVEDAVDAVGSADVSSAIGAWEDAWIAAGTLQTRLDSMRDAAITLLGALPSDEGERSLELEQELGTVIESHTARWRSVTDGVAEAGRRLQASAEREALLHASSASNSSGPASVPASVPAIAIAVPLPIHVPDRITVSVAPERDELLVPEAAPVVAAAVPAKAPIIVRTTVRQPARPRETPVTPRIPDVRTATENVAVAPPVAPEADRAGTERFLPGEGSPAAAAPQAATAGNGARRRATAAMALVVVVSLAAVGAMLAVSIGPLGRDAGSAATADPDPLGGSDGESPASAATRSTASVTPSASDSRPGSTSAPPLVVTVDLHPVGPVDPAELAIARIIGAPEVVPFPTPFDRSIRLTGAAAGLCFELPAPGAVDAASIAFDAHLGEVGSDGTLVVILAAADDGAEAIPLAIDLTAARELDRDAWFRFVVTSDGDDGQLVVAPLGSDDPVLDRALAPDPTIVPTSNDQTCIQSALPDETSLFVDNLRFER